MPDIVITIQNLHRFDENERDVIIYVLRKCERRIWGAGGQQKYSKLPYNVTIKMKKLGLEMM